MGIEPGVFVLSLDFLAKSLVEIVLRYFFLFLFPFLLLLFVCEVFVGSVGVNIDRGNVVGRGRRFVKLF